MLDGIQYVTDMKGKPTAVLINLKQYGRVWEDIYDNLVAASRAKEPHVPWEKVKKRLKKQGKL